MARLKDRNRQIPNSLKFYQPETGWRPAAWSSFDTIVRGVIAMRKGNPFLLAKHQWPVDYSAVANEVDAFNAKICAEMGWLDYIELAQGDPPPKAAPLPGFGALGSAVAGVERMMAGATILTEMFGPNRQPVPAPQAEQRGAICTTCPFNDTGDWTRFFTRPASALVRKMLGVLKDIDLKTSHDPALHICSVCQCPLKVKVWTPVGYIRAHTPADMTAKLPAHCWIKNEP